MTSALEHLVARARKATTAHERAEIAADLKTLAGDAEPVFFLMDALDDERIWAEAWESAAMPYERLNELVQGNPLVKVMLGTNCNPEIPTTIFNFLQSCCEEWRPALERLLQKQRAAQETNYEAITGKPWPYTKTVLPTSPEEHIGST